MEGKLWPMTSGYFLAGKEGISFASEPFRNANLLNEIALADGNSNTSPDFCETNSQPQK